MTTLPDTARAVVTSGRLGHFTTIHADGRPHSTIVWVDLDGDDIVIAKLAEDQKVRNIRRDPRVSLTIEADGEEHGLAFHLVVEGTATVTPGGAPQLLGELAKRYIGPDAVFPPMPNPPDGFIIRITPTKVRGHGPWAAR
jgi:PPOX class probable F420-dependent enzyme